MKGSTPVSVVVVSPLDVVSLLDVSLLTAFADPRTLTRLVDSDDFALGLDGNGRIVLFDDTSSDGVLGLAAVDPSTGGIGGQISLGVAYDGYAQLDVMGDEALVSFDGIEPVPAARHVDLATGEVTELPTTARLSFLRSPIDASFALEAADAPVDEETPPITAVPTAQAVATAVLTPIRPK